MRTTCNVFVAISFIAWVSSAPHHHHHHLHKTVYFGNEGGGHADAGVAAAGGLSFSAGLGGNGRYGVDHQVVSQKVIDVEIPPPPEIKAQKTVIERTVVPQYVEKTVQVPTYVEKTIRVPTYVSKKVKVPVQPAVVEKTISHEHVPVDSTHLSKTVAIEKEFGYAPDRQSRDHGGFVAGGIGHGYAGAAGSGGGFFDRIFNIPIQTLGAVNGLLNGLSGSGHVSAGLSKSYSAY